VVTGTKKFERGLSRLLHTELHWLDVPERVMYKLNVMMYSCLHGQAPQTCSTSANQSLMSRHGVISDPLADDC